MNLRILNSHTLVGLCLIITFFSVAFYQTGDNIELHSTANSSSQRNTHDEDSIAPNNSVSSCNLFSGRWVFDNTSSPLYEERECSFMMNVYACEKHGRKDFNYKNWRWHPHHCDLPMFNGRAFLEKIRGKKLVFVGDSLNQNQWASMLCLIEPSLHQSSSKSLIRKGNLLFFHVTAFSWIYNLMKEYNASIGFYWSPLLVESNGDDPLNHRVRDRVIRITSIEKHAIHWTDADILIFDSFVWWVEVPTMTILWGSYGSSDAIYKRVETKLRRYEMALNTWSDWLEFNINRTKTKLFFMSFSPSHYYGERWSEEVSCYNETEPILKEGYWGIVTSREMMRIVESVIGKLERQGLRVEYLNITQLSSYRIDAHPSIYKKFLHPPNEEQLSNPKSYSDCIHWCLPGVPDVWNQILYSYILNS